MSPVLSAEMAAIDKVVCQLALDVFVNDVGGFLVPPTPHICVIGMKSYVVPKSALPILTAPACK